MVRLNKPLKGFVIFRRDLGAKGGVVPLETRVLLLEARVLLLEAQVLLLEAQVLLLEDFLLLLKERNLREELLGLVHLLLLDQVPLLRLLGGGVVNVFGGAAVALRDDADAARVVELRRFTNLLALQQRVGRGLILLLLLGGTGRQCVCCGTADKNTT